MSSALWQFFWIDFRYFWYGTGFFRPPHPQPHFRPHKFLQGTDFGQRMAFFGKFVNMVHQKVIGTTQIFLVQKHVYIHGCLKKSQLEPQRHIKILSKNLIFSNIWKFVFLGDPQIIKILHFLEGVELGDQYFFGDTYLEGKNFPKILGRCARLGSPYKRSKKINFSCF